ncbi:DNA cytosine methyltransferase [Hafnia alvei]|uniref:DNA cytosine methyltransferase n=1 Tax=Hafnia alvei TaxID=569 RepID=UPI0040453CDA
MAAYYNEIDPYAAQWLRNLIAAGHIAAGDVDERSIEDVTPDDLRNYTQCHFFAGIGVWSYALRRAGWSDDKPVWTGSCPCQPFSAAGQGGGFDDERHLWPHFHYLIEQCRPPIVFGEQVASKDGLCWFDLVQADLEGANYAVGFAVLPACGVGAPHKRERLFFGAYNVVDTGGERVRRRPGEGVSAPGEIEGREEKRQRVWTDVGAECTDLSYRVAYVSSVDDNKCNNSSNVIGWKNDAKQTRLGSCDNNATPTNGFWRDADWLSCRDGKWRPVEPSTFPLANGITARVGRLRAYGNAICAEVAETFIGSYMAAQEQK